MINIIKRDTPPSERAYQTTCGVCKTVFSFCNRTLAFRMIHVKVIA